MSAQHLTSYIQGITRAHIAAQPLRDLWELQTALWQLKQLVDNSIARRDLAAELDTERKRA